MGKLKKYKAEEAPLSIAQEPVVAYGYQNTNQQYFIIDRIKKGISYTCFAEVLADSPFTLSDWSNFLHLTDRTLLRYKIENKSFESIYAEKIIELTILIKKGIETFGNKEKFKRWLQNNNIALGSHTPKELLITSVGIQIVMQELLNIDYGILA